MKIYTEAPEGMTVIQNSFIDQYMPLANGEFVKVYIYLLRCADSGRSLSLSSIADVFNLTDQDIRRALAYWEKQELLTLAAAADGTITSITFLTPPARQNQPSEPDAQPQTASVQPETAGVSSLQNAADVTPPSRERMAAVREQHEIRQLFYVAEQYLQRPLTSAEQSDFIYYYDELHFSADLIEYLIEYCVENGHKSMHYIQKVALSWADEHITTVDQARNSSAFYNKTCYSILNAFGIKGRGPASAELDYIRKWLEDGNFELDLILEACNRTISAIHQPSFEYTDKILENWKTGNVRTLADVERLDSAFEQEKDRRKTPSGQNRTPSAQQPSKFRNFEERSYNMDELTKKLLRSN